MFLIGSVISLSKPEVHCLTFKYSCIKSSVITFLNISKAVVFGELNIFETVHSHFALLFNFKRHFSFLLNAAKLYAAVYCIPLTEEVR